MTLKSRVERIESGIDYAALSPEQVARLDVTRLSKQQVQRLNVLHLTETQMSLLNLRDLSDEQLEVVAGEVPAEVQAWLDSLSDEELAALIDNPAARQATLDAAPWYRC